MDREKKNRYDIVVSSQNDKYWLIDNEGKSMTLITKDLAAIYLKGMKTDLKGNGYGGLPTTNATMSSADTLSKSEPIKSSNSGKSNKHETCIATSSFHSEQALQNKKISKPLLQADHNRENNKKHKVEEGTSSAKELTKHYETHSYSQFSTDRKSLSTTSDKDIVTNKEKGRKIEKSVASQMKYKLPYHYYLKSTYKPRSMKSVNPTKSALNQTKKNHGVSTTLPQELKNQLTKEIPECSKPQVAINMQDPSKIINEACLNTALMELDALRLSLNGIKNLTENLFTSSHELAKVCSEIKERMKKLNNFNNQNYSDESVVTSSQGLTPMELEERDVDEVVIEPARDSEKSQTAVNEIVHKKEAQLTEHKINKTEKEIAMLPKNNGKYDSKQTLRYRQKADGLVELEEGSGVYVSERGLEYCKKFSRGSKDFARRLLVEVYSDHALKICSLTGTKARPGLDSYARRVLLRAVEKYAREQNWEKLETDLEITTHRRDIQKTLRSKLVNLRSRHSKHN